ncbi:MAG: B12-binding domain-containing protein, partial [Anaerolineae bacterium]
MAVLEELAQALINGNAPKTKELAQKAVDEGIAPGKVLNEGL